jgi:cystathionine gamma-synthase
MMKIETLAVHSGRNVDPSTKAVTPPIHLSTTFERDKDGEYSQGYNYSRNNNPNRESLEQCLAELENGEAAAAFSSGSAAAMSVLQSLSPGDHIIAPDDIYHGTRHLMKLFGKWDIKSSFVDMSDYRNVEAAVKETTKLIWIETPSNPLLKITDIKKISEIAHECKAITACDNTWATPILQSPLKLGVDLVVHATTKYLGGHSDVLGGAVIAKNDDDVFQKIREIQKSGGAVPSPFECWLVLRGIQTLPLRIKAQSESAFQIAKFLSGHKNVDKIHYPGLAVHPANQLAAKQMKMFGGMISFEVKGGRDDAMRAAANVKIFTRATSLGGPESLIEHRASVEGPDTKTPQNLLRLSVGLEHFDDLIEDLEHALSMID